MSINFDIMKWRGPPLEAFPVALADAPQDFAAVPWLELRALLKEIGARENSDEDDLRLDFEDGGSLNIRGQRDPNGSGDYVLLGLTVHAYWTHVLEIYRKALETDPALVLFDSQEGVFHNAATFEPLAVAQLEFQRKETGA